MPDTLQQQLDALMPTLITPALVCFPVRHHSPACAIQLRRWIREHRPRAVLVEGPEDFAPLLPHLVSEECIPPVALYTHFRPGGKTGKGHDARHAAYYPLCAYSPEWVALREGHAVGAELRFIDLDYPTQRGAEQQREESPGGLHVESLQEELYFRRSEFLQEAGRRLGCRDHDELWDHLAEATGWRKPFETFVRDVAAYCLITRLDTPAEVMEADGTNTREAVMAAAIREVLAQPHDSARGPVLVVTGGFHTMALPALIQQTPRKVTRVVPPERQTCLTRYSFPQLDSLRGYGAGMPNPGFYQAVWQAFEGGSDTPYHNVALDMLVTLGREARGRDLPASVSVADEIAAYEQALRLAQLRGHDGPAREDLLDAVRGCLIKGEMGADGGAILGMVRKLFTGSATGKVPPDAGVPALVLDFRRAVLAARLPAEHGPAQALALELYRKDNHRQTSRMLHRLEYLQVQYGAWKAGPDFVMGAGLRRVIEHWTCQWTPHTDTKLIEMSAYGSTLVEAAGSRLLEAAANLDLEAGSTAASGVTLVVRACVMGLRDMAAALAPRLEEWITRDGAFPSVAGALTQLVMLWQSREPLEARHIAELPHVMQTAYTRCCRLLQESALVKDELAANIVEGCLLVRQRLDAPEEETAPLDATLFWEALEMLLHDAAAHPLLRGASAGLLHTAGRLDAARLLPLVSGALLPASGDSGRQIGFLTGLLKTARELGWREPDLLNAVEQLLASWSDEEFLHKLPHLRVAWSGFTPRETDRVAAIIAQKHGREKLLQPVRHDVSEQDMLHALHITAAAEKALREDGLGAWLDDTTSPAEPTPASPTA